MPPRPPHDRHLPSSAISRFVDTARIEALLAPYLPAPQERAFVVRCVLGEGPAHHRGANYVLLSLLGLVLERVAHGDREALDLGASQEVPMRLPPHLARPDDAPSYPLPLPSAPLELLARKGTRDFEAMVDCLTDGPPQHALANVAMVTLLADLLARLPESPEE
ncbi:hypothetical protein HUW63_20650 [Myxococcus sp. AM001]|uniref:hypothetical protein n=1 Tax=Myxococcus vastator TaxID=2709664 RepID=UPI0013D4B3B9|nr:hypothetical protein [Myxococcus vastator]NVJ07640.1 hypothetical protein [Myxococcus sp. AM001]